jgi:hypothetical protein
MGLVGPAGLATAVYFKRVRDIFGGKTTLEHVFYIRSDERRC